MSVDIRKTIKIEKNGDGITWLYLNRPEKRNAMNPTMHLEMVQALEELETDDETEILVLTGEGTTFCAGQDLKEFFREMSDKPKEKLRVGRASQEWRLRKLKAFPKITIAMVNGWCCGGGFTPLIACDFAIAAEEAQFSLSEVNWGILPGGLVSKVIADAVSYRDALYYILTAENFDGNRAREIGLVNFVVPLDKLREETIAFARKLQQKNPVTLRAAKEAYRAVRTMDYEQAEDYLSAKSDQLKLLDKDGGGGKKGMHEFLDAKSYRPALDPYPR
jgi:trans-feruloyl-CoA hydratase/vanillin synthase